MPPDRIIVAGEFWHGAAPRGFAQAFRILGLDVHEIDIGELVVASRLLAFRVLNRLSQRRVAAEFNRRIVEAAQRLKPRYFFTVKGSFVERRTIELLKDLGVGTIVFYPDVTFDHPMLNLDDLIAYDLLATTKSFHLPFLGQRGANRIVRIDYGYTPLTHRARRDVTTVAGPAAFDWDICYIGNASRYKVDWLENVARAFGDRRFAVFGTGWAQFARGTALERHVAGYPLLGDLYADTIERSRINLAMHFGPVGNQGWQDAISGRTFHIPAVAGFMLHIDNPEVRALYDVPREIDVFASPAQLLERIAHHLAHEEERQAIAARGHLRCVPAYSLEARARDILDAFEVSEL